MRNLKRALSLVLAAAMLIGMMVVGASAASEKYSDAATVTPAYAEAIDVMTGIGVLKGLPDGTVGPQKSITRAEVAAMIYRAYTGDVSNTYAATHAGYARFDDVAANHWAAGYIGYTANALFIKGDGQGNFFPDANVTGYQALAMILRAMGYDQNGEFEGSGWEIRVAQIAEQRGMLQNITTGQLSNAASRELVAEILFQGIQKATVVYTPAFGYHTADVVNTPWNGVSTTSLGYKNFGLTADYGIVVGNQATGEIYSQINISGTNDTYVYDYATATSFNAVTGLDVFGHGVKVWYNAKDLGAKTVYVMYDKAVKAETVIADDANLATSGKLYAALVTAGFSPLTANAYYSNSYAQLTATRQNAPIAGAALHACDLYTVVSNNIYGTADVVVRVNAEVAQITAVNTTNVVAPTLTLGSSSFGTSGVIPMSKITAGSTTTLGSIVIANKIEGTNTTVGTNPAPYYDLDAVTITKTGTVVARDNTTGKVVLSDGTAIEMSPLAAAVKGNCVPMPNPWTNATYVFTMDNNGKYIGAVPYNTNTFLYGTFADYQSAGLSTGTVNYYMTGVTLDGQIVTKDITLNLGNPATAASVYTNLAVAKKAWNSNIFAAGAHTGYAVDANGLLTTNTTAAGVLEMNYDWTITKADVTAGFKANSQADTFFTNATKFIVVSGTGTDTLSVKTYNGIAELLGNADSVTLDAYVAAMGDGNIYYTVSNYIYNNVVGQTKHVDTVILGADDLDYVTTSNVYYAATVEAGLSSTVTVGGNLTSVTQYALYNDGAKDWYYIAGNAPQADKFYILTDTGLTVGNAPVYTVGQTTTGTDSGAYVYVGATNNLNTAVIDNVLYNVTNAKVVNLATSGVANPALALGSIAELNNAVSVGYTLTVDCVYDVVSGVSVIYVTGASL